LMRRQLARPTEPHAAILRALAAIAGTRNDQRALELDQDRSLPHLVSAHAGRHP